MGEEVKREVVKLMILLKLKGLSLGYSGISIETVEQLLQTIQ
jgi:histidine ammonia-lyase